MLPCEKYPDGKFQLSDLESLVGIPGRTIRGYIETGLLPKAIKSGRDTHYDEKHLNRLCAIRVLREREGFSDSEIRRRLVGKQVGESYIKLLKEHDPRLAPALRDILPKEGTTDMRLPKSAFNYVRLLNCEEMKWSWPALRFVKVARKGIRDEDPGPSPDPKDRSDPKGEEGSGTSGQKSGVSLPRAEKAPGSTGNDSVPAGLRRRNRPLPVLSMAITPEIELIIRGTWDPYDLARVEQAAQQLIDTLNAPDRND